VDNRKEKMMIVLIVGGGKVGRHLAALLAAAHQVKVIEMRPERIALVTQEAPTAQVFLGNGTDPVLLENSGIRQCDVVAAVTGQDETNLVVTTLARFAFARPRTIGRVNDPRNAWMFTATMGVDVAVNQADLMAHLIAEAMSLGDMMTLLKLRKGQYSLVEEKLDRAAQAVGQSIAALRLPPDCVLTAVLRGGQLLIPRAELILQADDEVLAVVHADQAAALAALLG
jgi:trk system potassium uptake protein TrkA